VVEKLHQRCPLRFNVNFE